MASLGLLIKAIFAAFMPAPTVHVPCIKIDACMRALLCTGWMNSLAHKRAVGRASCGAPSTVHCMHWRPGQYDGRWQQKYLLCTWTPPLLRFLPNLTLWPVDPLLFSISLEPIVIFHWKWQIVAIWHLYSKIAMQFTRAQGLFFLLLLHHSFLLPFSPADKF